jgi:hypothetical protein
MSVLALFALLIVWTLCSGGEEQEDEGCPTHLFQHMPAGTPLSVRGKAGGQIAPKLVTTTRGEGQSRKCTGDCSGWPEEAIE